MNCFGIPPEILKIKEFGGIPRNTGYYQAYDKEITDSREKIRVRNLEKEGTTLSNLTSIQTEEVMYNQDLHVVEVGFSPNESVNVLIEDTLTGNYVAQNYVVTGYVLTGSFDIDDFIGDPKLAQASQYKLLQSITTNITANLDTYDVFDFVRIIKFLDNTIFKMVKDFLPARDSISTGIIVKPHHLNRSKIIIPSIEWERAEYEGLIEVGEYSGSDGGLLTDKNVDHSLALSYRGGIAAKAIDRDTPKYDGELEGTTIDVLSSDLNGSNPFLGKKHPVVTYNTTTVTSASTFNSSTPSAGQIVVFYEEATIESPVNTGGLDQDDFSGPVDSGGGNVGGGSPPTSYTLTVSFSNMTSESTSSLLPLMNVSVNGTGVSSGNTTYTTSVNSGDTVSVVGSWAVNDFAIEDYKAELSGSITTAPAHASPVSGSTTVTGNTAVTFKIRP